MGMTFHFVHDGPMRALELAREAAGDRDARIAGGADVIQQYLDHGADDDTSSVPPKATLWWRGTRSRILFGVSAANH